MYFLSYAPLNFVSSSSLSVLYNLKYSKHLDLHIYVPYFLSLYPFVVPKPAPVKKWCDRRWGQTGHAQFCQHKIHSSGIKFEKSLHTIDHFVLNFN